MEKAEKKKVSQLLVTEDDPVLKRFYQQALEDTCEQLDVVESSLNAMNLLRNKRYDLLVTDLQLTEKDGLDIISCAVKHCPDIKILVASGYVTDEKYHDELIQIRNIKGFLQKPFTLEELLQKIETIVSSSDNPQT